ncbi:hypothetical protein C8J56DRAFT_1109520 [Mycena floridula]|nr:hypothetical protein C8J56DRAFT_1109520 [Mycena floridula]
MADGCKVCGFSASAEPNFPSEPQYARPPHIQELLNSNKPPSQIQEFQLRETLAQSLQSLDDLDAQISNMRHDIQQLVRERARKAAEIDGCKSVLHPIRRLPKEILCDIFLSFIEEDLEEEPEEEKESSSLNPLEMNWIVSCVSTDWRAITLSFPRLWSTVRIVADDFELGASDASKLHILAVQLDRAAHHKLSVSVYNSSVVLLEPSHPLLQILLSTSLRWRDLHLAMAHQSFVAFTSLRGSLTSLEKLHIWSRWSNPTDPTFSMFEFAPQLKTLWGHSNVVSRFSLSLSQITTFHSTRGTLCRSYPQLLVLMPNLIELQTTCSDADLEDASHDYLIPLSVRLPHLKHVAFSLCDEDEPHSSDDCVILSRLSLPVLQDLVVQLQSSTNELRGLLRRSGCSLKNMVLQTFGSVPREDCINLLLDVPTLESLTLGSDELLDEFIRNLSIVPALQRLKVKDLDSDFDPERITELKKSRPMLLVVEIDDTIY